MSAEIYFNYRNNQGTWPRVLKAVALLGGEIPAVTSLRDIEALYARTDLDGLAFKTYVADCRLQPGTDGVPSFAEPRYFIGEDDATGKFYVVDREDDNMIVAEYATYEQAEQAKNVIAERWNASPRTERSIAAHGVEVRRETPMEDTMLVQGTYEGTGHAVSTLTERYMEEHPGIPLEQAQRTVLSMFPDLARAYAASRIGETVVVVHTGKLSPTASGAAGLGPEADASPKRSGSA